MSAPVDAPLGQLPDGTPVAFGALGAVFHLEVLSASDEERLTRALDRVWEWFGERLAWTALSSARGPLERTKRAHLDYISSYPAHLTGPTNLPPGQAQFEGNNLVKVGRTDFYVFCNGGAKPKDASPFSLRFWAEIGTVPDDSPTLPGYAALHLTVPESWPLDDFAARVCAIAGELNLRCGSAGYTYSSWELPEHEEPSKRVYAHARRHPGYDVAEYVRLVTHFHARLRTVSWLTFVGASMVEELAGPLAPSGPVQVFPVGGATVLRAGAAPEKGDMNRLQIPAAYRIADAMVRPVRASDGKGMIFFGPWTEAEITEWFRRFEYRVS